MSIQVNDKNLGHATAYAYAVAGGYTGTEAEFTELLGNIADDLGQIENLTVTVETLAAGSSATASYSNGVLHLGIPKGDKGDGAYHVEPSGESFVIHTDASGVAAAQEFMIYIDARQGTTKKVISRVEGLPSISTGSGTIAPEIIKHAFTGSVATIIYTIPANTQISAGQINAQYTAYINDGTANGFGVRCALSVAVVKDGAKGDTGATGSTGPTGNGIANVAKTGTSGLVDTYTITYTNGNTSTFTVTNGAEAVDNTLTIAGRAADAKKTGDDISELKEDFTQMESDGVVPSAEQIISDKGITDSVPYHYRKTGGDGADRLYDQIVGGTVDWNQLVQNGNFEDTTSWNSTGNVISFTVANNKATLVCTQATDNTYIDQYSKNIISGHKYLVGFDYEKSASSPYAYWGTYPYVFAIQKTLSALSGRFDTVVSASETNTTRIRVGMRDNYATGEWTYSIWNVMMFDLTAMFGSTIADYIYQLEQTTAGAGVAFFKSLFPNDYYPYNSGELMSVSGLSAHKMVGFNQWDEEWEVGGIDSNTGAYIPNANRIRAKNYIKVIPDNTYYVSTPKEVIVYGYDDSFVAVKRLKWGVSGTIDTTGIKYIRFATTSSGYGSVYNHDICINLSDPAKNGTYEPYKAHSYPLDSTLTLRGLFKLDANNNLYADGDTYDADGTVTRNTILRAYQSGDESLANAITDGTNTVVYSANASTEQATPYQHLQQCDPSGTEEYVSTGIVPIGHNSFYPENLRAKVEQLPWNFSSLIAPTESTFTATRNYTTGSLFIVDNVLYKATANIANGGTITPNTNCTATTLAEIISALA